MDSGSVGWKEPAWYDQRYSDLAERMAGAIRANIEVTSGTKGLDVGCQNGRLTRLLTEQTGIEFTGLDPAPAPTKREDVKIKIVAGWAHEIPFPDLTFDVVSMTSVFEHIPPERRLPSIREIHRVLKPGGLLVGQIPNMYFPIELHSKLPFQSYLPFRIGRGYLQLFRPSFRGNSNIWYRVGPKMLRQLSSEGGFREGSVVGRSYPRQALPRAVRWAAIVTRVLPLGFDFWFRKG